MASTTVYYGDHFDHCQQHDYDEVSDWLEDGTVEERKMPIPTRRHPERTKTVYLWMGVRMQKHRDVSAIMPASVTIKAAEGSFVHRMIVKAWAPVMVPA